jgi:uncharacterized protein (DUF58 family)
MTPRATAAETGGSTDAPAGDETDGTGDDAAAAADAPTGRGESEDETADENAAASVLRSTAAPTHRWRGISAVAFLAGGAGMVLSNPSLLLAGAIGVAYAAYAQAATAPEVSLSVSRAFSDETPEPGDEVDVTVTVRNRGESFLPDLRLVDGVPDPLVVTDGVPRLGTALRPRESASFEYTVTMGRGTHTFDHSLVISRGMSGAVERRTEVGAADDLVCEPDFQPVSTMALRALTTRHAGRVETTEGGEGIEFHSTREYRPGDSLSRIDWNRHARTGELATLRFRQERSATAILVIDTREAAYLRSSENEPHAVDRSVQAATSVFPALLDDSNRVGVAAFGPGEAWLPPGLGSDHRARARELFTTDPVLSAELSEGDFHFGIRTTRLRKRFPEDAQVILFSPLCDDDIARLARLIDAHGHLVTVISPDPTTAESAGHRLAAAERTARIASLREAGIRVADLPEGTDVETALARAAQRWSQ